MRWKAGTTALAAAVAVTIALGACSSPDPASPEANEPAIRRQANTFVEMDVDAGPTDVCAVMTQEFLDRLAPPDGTCMSALHTLSLLTNDIDDPDSFATKKVGDITITGDEAVVVLQDKITGENQIPLRLVKVDGTWLVDEIGEGAQLKQACAVERTAVEAAVDEYLTDRTEYPPDTKALVPGYLEQLPDNHVVEADGKIVATGPCA